MLHFDFPEYLMQSDHSNMTLLNRVPIDLKVD